MSQPHIYRLIAHDSKIGVGNWVEFGISENLCSWLGDFKPDLSDGEGGFSFNEIFKTIDQYSVLASRFCKTKFEWNIEGVDSPVCKFSKDQVIVTGKNFVFNCEAFLWEEKFYRDGILYTQGWSVFL